MTLDTWDNKKIYINAFIHTLQEINGLLNSRYIFFLNRPEKKMASIAKNIFGPNYGWGIQSSLIVAEMPDKYPNQTLI